jgi:hypothetical protein
MKMVVGDRFVPMLMLVVFGQVQPDASHANHGREEGSGCLPSHAPMPSMRGVAPACLRRRLSPPSAQQVS